MKSIGVIGQGFVGGALSEGMKHVFNVYSYDIKNPFEIKETELGSGNVSMITLPYYTASSEDTIEIKQGKSLLYVNNPYRKIAQIVDGPIFLCVPTPMNSDGSCNTSIVEKIVEEFDSLKMDLVLVVKSTVIPGTVEKLNEKYKNVQICFNPEFLTEANAVEDFKNQDRIIIGGPRPATNIVKQMYQEAYPDVPTTKTSSTIAELVKYTTNCFLATKVSFANELKQICDALEVDYDKVIEYATKDKRLGTSHWSVPGTDGTGLLGFGLTCFPKDLNALIARACDLGVDPKVMKAVWEKNCEVRPGRDWAIKGRSIS